MKILQEIVVLEKKLEQTKKNRRLFKSREPSLRDGENPNSLAAKLESDITAYESTIRDLKSTMVRNRSR
jgi:hypothetical protein